MTEKQTCIVTGRIVHETPDATLLATYAPGSTIEIEIWIPKSQIEEQWDEDDNAVSLEIPKWLAYEKDLV